jgi:hypothetical protein
MKRDALIRILSGEHELFEERAAIREYMGEQPRSEAELGAVDDVVRWYGEA